MAQPRYHRGHELCGPGGGLFCVCPAHFHCPPKRIAVAEQTRILSLFRRVTALLLINRPSLNSSSRSLCFITLLFFSLLSYPSSLLFFHHAVLHADTKPSPSVTSRSSIVFTITPTKIFFLSLPLTGLSSRTRTPVLASTSYARETLPNGFPCCRSFKKYISDSFFLCRDRFFFFR